MLHRGPQQMVVIPGAHFQQDGIGLFLAPARSPGRNDERWKDAGEPQPLVHALRDTLKPLLAQREQDDHPDLGAGLRLLPPIQHQGRPDAFELAPATARYEARLNRAYRSSREPAIWSLRHTVRHEQRRTVKPLQAMRQHRPIDFFKDIEAHFDAVVWIDGKNVAVKRRMM